MDFRVGGTWLYAMQGPEGDTHWCRADYEHIDPMRSYTGTDAFCDESGTINSDFPRARWHVTFIDQEETTLVKITIRYNSLEDLEKIVSLGFKEGFTAALENLDTFFKQ